jgi:hypothetical protein
MSVNATDASVNMRDAAADLRKRRIAICRLLPGKKNPIDEGWTLASLEPEDFDNYPNANIGIQAGALSGNLVIVDPDTPEIGREAQKRLPRTMTDVVDPSGGKCHLSYRVTDIPPWAIAARNVAGGAGGPRTFHFHNASGKPIGLDFLGTGAQAACPPSLHHSGKRRIWTVPPSELITLHYLDLWKLVQKLAKDFGAVNADRETAVAPDDASDNTANCASGFRGAATGTVGIEDRAVAYLNECCPAISGEGGHSALFWAARVLVRGFTLPQDQSLGILKEHYNQRCKPPWSDSELWHKVEDAKNVPFDKPWGWLLDEMKQDHCNGKYSANGTGTHHANGEPAVNGHSEKPVINTDDGDLERLTQAAWKAIHTANEPPFNFRHGAIPSRIEKDDDGIPVVRVLTVDRTRHLLARVARWEQTVKQGRNQVTVAAAPPLSVVHDLLATPDPPLPILTRVVEAPVFAADGTLQTTPGYSAASRTYYATAPGFTAPEIPRCPSGADIVAARDIIDELLCDFPFISDAERAHAIAVWLLAFARDLIDGPTPLHAIEASTPGTGKTLLVYVLTYAPLGLEQAYPLGF